MNIQFRWLAVAISCFLAPFVLVVGLYNLAEIAFPGRLERSLWETWSSVIFLSSLLPVWFVATRPAVAGWRRFTFGAISTAVFLLGALSMQVHTLCGETPRFIGEQPKEVVLASCS